MHNKCTNVICNAQTISKVSGKYQYKNVFIIAFHTKVYYNHINV